MIDPGHGLGKWRHVGARAGAVAPQWDGSGRDQVPKPRRGCQAPAMNTTIAARLNPETLMNWPFGEVEQAYTFRESILYALGLGLPQDPLDREELRYVYESGQTALPTMAVVLCHPGAWYREPETGIDWVRMLHGEQSLVLHRPLPVAATVVGRTRVTQVVDKGEGRGALLYLEREITDKQTRVAYATIGSTLVLRGNGGCGSTTNVTPALHAMPERGPDVVSSVQIDPRAALIYRLSGDYNPLHVEPEIAARAGFKAPIFHGLGSYGMVGVEVLRATAGFDPDRLKSMSVRFTAPVYPGERLEVSCWVDDGIVSFRATVPDRGVTAIDNGRAQIAAAVR